MQQCAQRQPDKQAADVRRIINSLLRKAISEVVADKGQNADEVAFDNRTRQRTPPKIPEGAQPARHAEDRARSACAYNRRIAPYARQAAAKTAQQVEREESPVPEHPLGQPPQTPQT